MVGKAGAAPVAVGVSFRIGLLISSTPQMSRLDAHEEAVRAARLQARNEALEEAAGKLDEWTKPQTLLLACGEMEPQELRTCLAVLKQRASAIRELKE